MFVLTAATSAVASPAQARRRAIPLTRSRLGRDPFVVIHDEVLSLSPGLRARIIPSDAYGGSYNTPDGTQVTVYMSSAYVPDDSVLQSVANLLDGFYHGAELADVTIYLAPEDEIHVDCQSTDADSCFDPSTDTIYLVGTPPSDGTPVEEIAAHEYGHAIAFGRLNPWGAEQLAYNLGPEYWASYEGVCARTQDRTAFPGDEGAHYSENPGEAWADTNRLLNGGSPSLWQFDPSFFPNSTDFRLAKKDILNPWTGNTRYQTIGTFRPYQSASRNYTLTIPDDGPHANIKLFAHGTLTAGFYLYSGGALIGKATGPSPNKAIRFSICGARHARVRVARKSGYGTFTLQANIP
jgi:hypothetical protein